MPATRDGKTWRSQFYYEDWQGVRHKKNKRGFKTNRKITIPPFLAEELKEYCSHLYGIMPNERMFRFTKSYMEHEIVRGIKETGVKRIRIHDLRHSHASLLVELGFQPLAIAERLGHEKIETTLNTYSHLYPNKQAELANRLELENEEDNL